MRERRADVVAVLPAFDCEATVGAVVGGVLEHLASAVVVSDGSRDATAATARAAGAVVEELPANRGKGFALRAGIARALELDPRALLLLDADGQHSPDDIPALLVEWDRGACDLLIGCRLEEPERIPKARFWTNFIGSRVLSWMTGVELHDSQSGFRLLDAGLARRLDLRSAGYAIESEMLIKAARRGARIGHARVATIYNGAASHYRPLADTLRISCAAIYFKVFDDS